MYTLQLEKYIGEGKRSMGDMFGNEREKLYWKWKGMRYDGQAFYNEKTIEKCKKISDENFGFFVEYQDYCINNCNMDVGIFKTRRSKIIDFLSSDFIGDISINNISQEIIENYFMSYLGRESDNTYNARYSYIKTFLEYFSQKMANRLEFEGLRLKKNEVKESELFVRKSLTAQQIALC